MMVDWSWVLILAGALLVLIEVAFGGFAGFDLVLIGSALVLGGAVGLLAGSASTGFIVASALCIAYIVIGRRWVRARMVKGKHTSSNVDALIGASAVVTQRVGAHEPGMIRVDGEIWRAVPAEGASGPFEPGAVVTVAAIDGVTLQVRG